MRIAMWSGPRNLSTALMYSFAARSDCAIWDEPFYAAYLLETGLEHPLRQEIIASWPHNPKQIAKRCIGNIPNDKNIFYQKHMTQHMLPQFDRDWINNVINVFLIRHPARVIASYHAKREQPNLADIGFREQAEIFDMVAKHSATAPIVIDSADIRKNPKKILTALCNALGIPFDENMLCWPKGGHPDDGPWAKHWYQSVWNSSGFADQEGPLPKIDIEQQSTLEQASPIYRYLEKRKLAP